MTFQQLINMGYDETLSFQASAKYGKNINKAIEFITQKQKNEIKTSTASQKTSTTYEDRIDNVLKLNDKIDKENNKHNNIDEYKGKDIYDLVNNMYSTQDNEGIHKFTK